MGNSRRVEISIETHEVLIIRQGKQVSSRLCSKCAGGIEMVTVSAAAVATGLSQRDIFRSVEAGLLHSSETADGQFVICLNSLLQ